MEKNIDIKKILRKEITEISASLSDDYIAFADNEIFKRIVETELYKKSSVIFTYIGVNREIATIPLIVNAIDSGKTVCAPIIRGDGIMDAARITNINDLNKNSRGLLEPDGSSGIIDPNEIDFVFVPCLTCDPFGNRIGYGGGYYDRYLKRINSAKTCSISACRERTFSMHLPQGEFDVAIDFILTESSFSSSLLLS